MLDALQLRTSSGYTKVSPSQMENVQKGGGKLKYEKQYHVYK